MAAYPQYDIKAMRQPGKGKADAVFTAFDAARGDVLMILDADLTMPPEQLPKFWQAIQSGKGEFVNGSRLVYPMEDEAMRFLNLVANKTFSLIFTWLLSQRLTDTLCGTKVLRRTDYQRLKAGRVYFGDFDPFGDFDLIFGVIEARPEDRRGADPVRQPHLWRDPNFPVPPRGDAAANGPVRVSAHQGHVSRCRRRCTAISTSGSASRSCA